MMYEIRTFVLRLLHIPLLYKVLVVNCTTTVLLCMVGVLVAIQHVQAPSSEPHFDLIALFLVAGIIVSLLVDFLLLRLVFAPLNHLEAAVDDAVQGKQHPITPSLMGDERLDRLAATFTGMQKTLEDDTRRIHRLSQQIVYAHEAERQRIARDLHDEVAQTLTSVLLYLKLLELSSDPEQTQRLQNLRKLITHALNDIRQMAVDLHPKVLDDWGLEAALGQRVDELNADSSRQVTLQVVGRSAERLPRDLELTFYHVAQEALSNIVLHARAGCAQVVLKREANCLTLEVQDDGVGFNPDVTQSGRASGFGLASMRERLALVNGELAIDSQPGRGTRICARAPMSTLPSQKRFPGRHPEADPVRSLTAEYEEAGHEEDPCLASR